MCNGGVNRDARWSPAAYPALSIDMTRLYRLISFWSASALAISSVVPGAFAQSVEHLPQSNHAVIAGEFDSEHVRNSSSSELLTFTVLGSMGGPIPDAVRAQPANLVRFGETAILLDAGDGATQAIARTGLSLGDIDAIVISHFHSDHLGGLFAMLAQREHGRYSSHLTIVGPPGIKALIEDLVAAIGVADPQWRRSLGSTGIPHHWDIREIVDGEGLTLGDIELRAAENSHYSTAEPDAPVEPPISLSFRFAAGGIDVVYTGDTGPSEKVEQLCEGADILVSELIDIDSAISGIVDARPDLDPNQRDAVERHLRTHHLQAADVARMANSCRPQMLIVTHFVGSVEALPANLSPIAVGFSGPIIAARDGQSFRITR